MADLGSAAALKAANDLRVNDNTAGEVTPADVRGSLTDTVDTVYAALTDLIEEDPGAGIGMIESGTGVTPFVLKNIKSGTGTEAVNNTGSVQINVKFTGANKYHYGDISGGAVEGDLTAAGRALLDDADASAQRTTLGLGSLATVSDLTGPVTSTGGATAIADGALSIAKTSGLQAAIDAKVADAINDGTTTVAPSQNAVFDALALKAPIFSIVTETTTARTLGLADVSTMISCTNSGAVTITVAPQSSVTWTGPHEIYIVQDGTGQVTIAPGSGVTLRSSRSLSTYNRYSAICLKRTASDAWLVTGDTE